LGQSYNLGLADGRVCAEITVNSAKLLLISQSSLEFLFVLKDQVISQLRSVPLSCRATRGGRLRGAPHERAEFRRGAILQELLDGVDVSQHGALGYFVEKAL